MRLSPVRPQLAEEDCLKRILLLVDYSNILYRSYFSSIKDWEERPWLPILRFVDSLRLCIQRSKVPGVRMEIIFAGESREKLERTKIDSSYKSNRIPVKHDVFRNFRKIMVPILRDMGTGILSRAGAEADDVIAGIVGLVAIDDYPLKNYPLNSFKKKQKTDIVIFSNDKDLYQLLRFKRCYIYKAQGVFYTREHFIDEYKFHPDKFALYKAMAGDKSDNIPGINGIGPVKATEYILNDSVPVNDPELRKALTLISLDYDLDVPTVGKVLRFDSELSHSKRDILKTYGKNTRAFAEIQLALNMLKEVYLN